MQADWEGDEEAAAEADESANPVAKGHAVIADLCGEGGRLLNSYLCMQPFPRTISS